MHQGQTHIGIIEDDEDLRRGIQLLLEQHRFKTVNFPDAARAWEYVRLNREPQPDLWIVDVMLPGLWDGLDFIRELRELPQGQNATVLVLTARGKEQDIVRGLELGADDYLVKPYRPKELIARIRALLRRNRRSDKGASSFQWGPVTWNPDLRLLTIQQHPVDFTARETDIVALLLENTGRYFTREEIFDRVWGYDAETGLRTVDVHIRHIRKKLGPYGQWLISRRGLGYAWRPTAASSS